MDHKTTDTCVDKQKTDRHLDGFDLSFTHADAIFFKGEHKILRCPDTSGYVSVRDVIKENYHKLSEDELYQVYYVSHDEETACRMDELPITQTQLICIHHFFVSWNLEIIDSCLYLRIHRLLQMNELELLKFDFQNNILTLYASYPDNWDKDEHYSLFLYRNEKLYTFDDIEVDTCLKVHIDLKHFHELDNNNYGLALLAGEHMYHLHTDMSFQIDTVLSEQNNFEKMLHVEIGEDASIQIREVDFQITPEVTSVSYEDDTLILNGYLKHDFDLFHYQNMSYVCTLDSYDDQKHRECEMTLDGYAFTLHLHKDEICALNKEHFRRWDMAFVVLKDKEPCASFGFVKSSALSGSILFTHNWMDDGYQVMFELNTTRQKQEMYFGFRQPYFVQKVNYVEIKKRSIRIHVRMNSDVDNFYRSMQIYLFDDNTKPCKVKKRGVRTLMLTYRGGNFEEIAQRIKEVGCFFILKVKEERYRNDINDLDRTRIYSSFTQHVFNSKRYRKLGRVLYRKLFLRMPVRHKKVLFESFLGRNVSGNPKYIYKYMNDNGYGNAYKMYWILNDPSIEVEGCGKVIQRRSIRYYYHMATAGYWIFNTRQDSNIIKREQTTYLQTWHGTPLKRLGMDMDSVSMATVSNIIDYKREFMNNSRRWDYMLAQNQYSADIFKRCFAFRKQMLTYGYPANDILYNASEKDIEKLKEKFNLPTDKKIVLYAPTWRDDNFLKKGYYQMKMQLDLDMMKEALGDDTIVLLRMHYLIMNSIDIEGYQGFAYDFSGDYDIQELYLVSDVLITDYSSTMFDFANLKRPIIFFTYDIDDYRDSLRGFYFDFEKEAPGPIVKTTAQVISSLQNISSWRKAYKEKEEAFYQKFNHIDDGKAAKRVLDTILAVKEEA